MLRFIRFLRARPVLLAVAAVWLTVSALLGYYSWQEMVDNGGWNPGKPMDLFANETEQ